MANMSSGITPHFSGIRSAVGFSDLHYYGGFFEALLKLFSLVLPLGNYEVRHLITGLFGVGGVVGCWKIARLLCRPSVLPSLAPCCWRCIRPTTAHIFINSKDIPFAVLYVWAVYYLVKLVQEFPKMSCWTAARFGIASGLTMAVRVGGLLLLCYLFLTLAILLTSIFLRRSSLLPSRVGRHRKINPWRTPGNDPRLRHHVDLLASRNPRACSSPPLKQWHGFRVNALSHQQGPMLPIHLLYKLPELYLLLIVVGLCLAIRTLYRYARKGSVDFPRVLSYGLVGLSALLPVIYAVVTKPFLYDEIRHFLFVIPPAVFAAWHCAKRIAGSSLRENLDRPSGGPAAPDVFLAANPADASAPSLRVRVLQPTSGRSARRQSERLFNGILGHVLQRGGGNAGKLSAMARRRLIRDHTVLDSAWSRGVVRSAILSWQFCPGPGR